MKKIIALLLAAAMMIVVAGCGGGDQAASKGGNSGSGSKQITMGFSQIGAAYLMAPPLDCANVPREGQRTFAVSSLAITWT